ncbi:MAG TPA: hypothetical protein VNH11_19760 [Pirellulales bacterium]|nr:hypothetical protein [Pirellulales bacterium]
MRSLFQSWQLAGGALGIVLLLLGAAQGGAPASVNGAGKAAAAAQKPRRTDGGATSNDLKLIKPRGRNQAADTADGELLDQTDRQNRTVEGFLRAEVRNGLNRARQTMGSNPEQAQETLQLLIDKVRRAGELRAKVRTQLVESLEAALRAARREVQAQAERRLEAQQAAAEREALERINRALFLQEQKTDQLMLRFNALMGEERYRDAEALAAIAEEMNPGQAGLRGAELTARMVGYAADMNAVRDMRHRGFVDAAYQVELSHVSSPDEPPIIYPDVETWQLLTERRKKYKAVDVKQHGPSETKILAALDDKTELDFTEQPLTDVIDYLKQRHNIEIQLDNRAIAESGIGSDAPVTRSIKGITLRSALKLLLGEMDLTYVLRNEVLLITSRTEAENMLSTRVYPVADLVVPIQQPRAGGMGGMGSIGPGMGGTSGGMGGGMGGMGGGMGGMGGGMGMGMGMGGGMF